MPVKRVRFFPLYKKSLKKVAKSKKKTTIRLKKEENPLKSFYSLYTRR